MSMDISVGGRMGGWVDGQVGCINSGDVMNVVVDEIR